MGAHTVDHYGGPAGLLRTTGNRPGDDGNPPTSAAAVLKTAPVQGGLVSAGGLPDDGGERLDEGGRVGPSAGGRGGGDRPAVGQVDHGVVDAQDRAPALEAHAQVGVEQAAQGALTRSRGTPQLGQGRVLPGVGAQQVGDGPQPVVVRVGQVQGLLGRLDEV